MNNELLYQIALTQVPNIGDIHAKSLLTIYQDASAIFKAPRRQLEAIEGIGKVRANNIKSFKDFKTCEEEIRFIQRFNISALFMGDENYPKRLLNCYDSPVLLFYRGNANLNTGKIIAIAGTRNQSDYGKWVCEKFIHELKEHHVLILSGLAFGIDSIAHREALKNNMETVAVLAHGLDRIYPTQNKSLAKQMLQQGGLLTDFKSGTNPDRQNFPRRNRITAGMSDAVVIIESAKTGGSLITAEIANSYNKDVFAFPGRVNDPKSEGCNYLIKNNKACMVTSASDLIDIMNWKDPPNKIKAKQKELFIDLNPAEKQIIDSLMQENPLHIDDIYARTGLNNSTVAGALLSLEMNGIIISMPGKKYRIS